MTAITENAPSSRKNKVFDVVVVGGGPGGTAAAFRARELGLSVLVLEYDDLMKRIRDYSKDKLILPDFGGGERLRFPKAGPLIEKMAFQPIDKDDLCRRWKALYNEHHVVHRIGLELTGLKHCKDGSYLVVCWNHNKQGESAFLAQHVVLALGNGVPRHMDIPGNTDGIALRMENPQNFVGEPACVIGGGTSAAEAVIAISNAKISSGDPSAVFWSYRGDRLPRVSKALAEVFFEAYAGNGNIRYFPKSEPMGIVVGEDHLEYLAIRIDRRCIPGRPNEITLLEFPKHACLACIGEDKPTDLLNSLGVPLVSGGPRNKKRALVNNLLETRRPKVFMIGDMLSQAYLRTNDFDGNPSTFEEIKHRGNIKAALRDGVFVAEVIAQMKAGKSEISIQLEDQEALPAPKGSGSILKIDPKPATPSQAPVSSTAPPSACLYRTLTNGILEREFPLGENRTTTLGSSGTDITFSTEDFIAGHHATICHDRQGYRILDNNSEGGVFLSLPPGVQRLVQAGDLLRVGRQFLLICTDQGRYGVIHYDAQGQQIGIHQLSSKAKILGREAPDITLDARDMSLSRRHLAIAVKSGTVVVKDLDSANHSFIRVQEEAPLRHGDLIQIGRELLTFTIHAKQSGRHGPEATMRTTGKISSPSVPSSSETELRITFAGLGKTVTASPGQTICEVAEANGIAIKAECHAGICGSDPIKILEGRDNLAGDPDEVESETLEDLCGLKPGPCRLACKARIKGPVTVQIC